MSTHCWPNWAPRFRQPLLPSDHKWLAAARLNGLSLYVSSDDAKTWVRQQELTGPQRHPAHFTRLQDGRVLLSYGNRLQPKGVDVRLSADEGATWSEPRRVVDFQGDGGYPSSLLAAKS